MNNRRESPNATPEGDRQNAIWKPWTALILFALAGCAMQSTHQAKLDHQELREVLMDYTEAQIMDNLVRARNGLPIMQFDFTTVDAAVTTKFTPSATAGRTTVTNSGYTKNGNNGFSDVNSNTSGVSSNPSLGQSIADTLTGAGAVAATTGEMITRPLGLSLSGERDNAIDLQVSPLLNNPNVYTAYVLYMGLSSTDDLMDAISPPKKSLTLYESESEACQKAADADSAAAAAYRKAASLASGADQQKYQEQAIGYSQKAAGEAAQAAAYAAAAAGENAKKVTKSEFLMDTAEYAAHVSQAADLLAAKPVTPKGALFSITDYQSRTSKAAALLSTAPKPVAAGGAGGAGASAAPSTAPASGTTTVIFNEAWVTGANPTVSGTVTSATGTSKTEDALKRGLKALNFDDNSIQSIMVSDTLPPRGEYILCERCKLDSRYYYIPTCYRKQFFELCMYIVARPTTTGGGGGGGDTSTTPPGTPSGSNPLNDILFELQKNNLGG